MRIPKHIGVIPDGNRRWAVNKGMTKEKGYENGLQPGLELYKNCKKLGINEITFYGFTVDNTKRPSIQRISFTDACINAVKLLSKEDAELLVLGDTSSKMFPKELTDFSKRKKFGNGGIKVNFLVNYSWEWDLGFKNNNIGSLHSNDVSRIDLIIRWGGRQRLSGFLPVQSVYSDFYFINDFWPDYKEEHVYEALDWYNRQDITLGG